MARLLLRDLTPGTAYKIQLRAADGDSYSEWSRKFDLLVSSDSVPPDTPEWALTDAWVPSGNTFVATWQPVDTGLPQNTDLDHYELELSDGINSVVVHENNTSYTLTFEDNRTYFSGPKATVYAKVRAVDKVGNVSDWSSQLTATNPPPADVTGLAAVAGMDSVELSWSPNTDTDLDHYEVWVGTTAGFTNTTLKRIYSGNSTRVTYHTSTYSLQYFHVRAVDIFNQYSINDAEASATPISPFLVDTVPPATPTGLTATMTTATNGLSSYVDLSWAAVSDTDLAGYTVRYRKAGSSDAYDYQTIPQTDTSTRVELATIYTNWDFQIRAYDSSANYSDWSAPVTATAPVNSAPADVTGLTSTADNNAITYSWTAVADLDIKNYEVTLSTSPTFASGNITYKTGNATTLTVGGLTANTTYYARVRAVDTAGNTSASWSATDTRTTGTNPAASTSDGVVPGTPSAPSVVGRFNSLYVTWAPVTTNASSGPQNDTVTYEVHLSTTTGFTPNSGTKVTEVDATSALITNLPGTTTALSYGTPYYIKLVAKDRDGSSGVSAEGSASLSKIASNDVTSIGADLIVPGTGFAAALVINTGGSIQSSNYDATHGWKISPTGAEFNDSGTSLKADAIKAGTLGGSGGSGVINIGAGTSLIFNGGYLKSNTYTGTSQASNPSGAGFYLGDDGIRIDQGVVSAAALATGSITGQTITLNGAGASIVGAGGNFVLSGSGLTIPDGFIAASKITLGGNAQNLLQGVLSGFESPNIITEGKVASANSATLSIDTTNYKFGTQSLRMTYTGTAGTERGIILGAGLQNNSPGAYVDAGKTYIFSMYYRNNTTSTTNTLRVGVNYGMSYDSWIPQFTMPASSAGWQRVSGTFTVPAGISVVTPYIASTDASFDVSVDGVMVEEKIGSSSSPSTYSPSTTLIDGGIIKTGSIQSQSNITVNGVSVPKWSINTQGYATFAGAQILGNTILGNANSDTDSYIQSYNYSPGSAGWKIRADGYAELGQVAVRGLGTKLDSQQLYVTDFTDMSEWNNQIGGSLSYRYDLADFGEKSLQSDSTYYTMYGNARIPFDEKMLYKVTLRVRSGGGTPKFYMGVRNFAADKVTLSGGSSGNWYGITNQAITTTGTWYEYTAYFQGTSGANGVGGGTVTAPGKLPVGTKYFAPQFLLNYGAVAGDIMQVSMYKVEAVSSVRDVQTMWGHSNNSTLIDGGNIYTGTVTANAIQSDSITTGKLTVGALGDELIRNGNFQDGAENWAFGGTPSSYIGYSSNYPGGVCALIPSVNGTYGYLISNWFPVTPGETYGASAAVSWTGAAPNGFLMRLKWADTSYATVTYSDQNFAPNTYYPNSSSARERVTRSAIAPSGARWGRIEMYNYPGNTSATTSYIYVNDVSMRRAIGGNLIVDGAIDGQTITGVTITGATITGTTSINSPTIIGGTFETGNATDKVQLTSSFGVGTINFYTTGIQSGQIQSVGSSTVYGMSLKSGSSCQLLLQSNGGTYLYGTSVYLSAGYTEASSEFKALGKLTGDTLWAVNPPSVTAAANTNLSATGQIRLSTSSKRFKKNIRRQPLDLDAFYSLKPKSFEPKTSENGEEGRYLGFIAEEVAEAGLDFLVNHDAEGVINAINYPILGVYAQAALVDQKKKIEKLQTENKNLKARMTKLEKLVA